MKNVWISIRISLKIVSKDPIDKKPTLLQIMACRLVGVKPLSETMVVRLPTHICVTRLQWVNMDWNICRHRDDEIWLPYHVWRGPLKGLRCMWNIYGSCQTCLYQPPLNNSTDMYSQDALYYHTIHLSHMMPFCTTNLRLHRTWLTRLLRDKMKLMNTIESMSSHIVVCAWSRHAHDCSWWGQQFITVHKFILSATHTVLSRMEDSRMPTFVQQSQTDVFHVNACSWWW